MTTNGIVSTKLPFTKYRASPRAAASHVWTASIPPQHFAYYDVRRRVFV